MDLRYARIRAFYTALQPISGHARGLRMRRFAETMRIAAGMRVLDLGGQPLIWQSVATPLDITILNLPGVDVPRVESHHSITHVEGDACNVVGFGDRSFDLVFSNSVIEHVGADERQAAFASEVRRLGRSYWVQTPAIWFPIEAHSGMPFWFWYPAPIRRRILEAWRKKLPAWVEMVEGTRVFTRRRLEALFPEATLWVERLAGVPKSYVAYSRAVDS